MITLGNKRTRSSSDRGRRAHFAQVFPHFALVVGQSMSGPAHWRREFDENIVRHLQGGSVS
jgi:hypothetical protein